MTKENIVLNNAIHETAFKTAKVLRSQVQRDVLALDEECLSDILST